MWPHRTLSLYGGGEFLLLTPAGQLWHVHRNTADGDTGAHNNCDWGISRRVPPAHPQLPAWTTAVCDLDPE